MNRGNSCPICSASTISLGSRVGKLDNREFLFRHCESCRYSYVENFRSDFDNIYDENYYHGCGADPMVNYVYEINNASRTIRNYEWEGIYSIYKILCPNGDRWLDYGCGLGGLVRFAINKGVDAIGFEEGWAADSGRESGVPILNSKELDYYEKTFDFISAIEVFEHISKPVDTLIQIRKLLKPGGVLFITTGNAAPWRQNLLNWNYTECPDVHISFYEPETLCKCLSMAGFQPNEFVFLDGFVDIIKYKILKTFRLNNRSILFDILPWNLIGRLVDYRHKVSKQPYGIAIEN